MKKTEREECVLYDRECIGCMECEVCDLDESKVCDNCGKCLEIRDDAVIKIDKIIIDPEDNSNTQSENNSDDNSGTEVTSNGESV